MRVVRFEGPETAGGARRSSGVVGEGARRRRATARKVAGRSDGEGATPTSDRCGIRGCCIENEVGIGGDAAMEGRPAKRVATGPPVSVRDDQRPSSSFTGGLHAHVRRRNFAMDARSTSRFAQCNVDRECHRSVEVVPRYGRCSQCVLTPPSLLANTVNVRVALYSLRGSLWERHRTLALLMPSVVVG